MSKNNIFFYEDDYMFFTFNGIHSSKYNAIIQQDKDRTLYVSRNTKIEFVQPQNQTGQYLLGVSHPQRTIPLKLVASNVSGLDIEHILKWLKPGATGNLCFDSSSDWEYDVVISEIKNPTQILVDYNLYDLTLDVTFATLENSIARNTVDGTARISLAENTSMKLSNTTAYNLPAFSYYVIDELQGSTTTGNKMVIANIHFLGNETVELGFLSEFIVAKNAVTAITNNSVVLKANDIYNNSCGAYLRIRRNTSLTRNFAVEYSAKNNLFMINNIIAEEAIANDTNLISKPNDAADKDTYSHITHNRLPITLQSPGSPHLLNDMSAEEILTVISTHYPWCICETSSAENDLTYYIGTTFVAEGQASPSVVYDTQYISGYGYEVAAQEIYARVQEANSCNHKVYLCYYHQISFITNGAFLTPRIRQYNFLA